MNNAAPTTIYHTIIHKAWAAYGSKRDISTIEDVSVNVSTNRVFRITFTDASSIMAKVSHYGTFENFKDDHTIINAMAHNLEHPYELFLSSSLMKQDELFLYRYDDSSISVWLVFYRAVHIKHSLPKRLDEELIKTLGTELAKFHKTCDIMAPVLPQSSKNLQKDIYHLLRKLQRDDSVIKFANNTTLIETHCNIFLEQFEKLSIHSYPHIPVFVDWNIGNFSVHADGTFYSRWDYDWFRMSSRVMDFYSFSRVVSDIGDKTDFSYTANQLNEDRFLLFLKAYHTEFPLSRQEVLFIKEAYRFFILHYVVSSGKYFFTQQYAKKLQKEAYSCYLPQIDALCNCDIILQALNI